MTGSAVVTTRLSSVAMKTAIEVIANVQSVRVLADIYSSLGSSTTSNVPAPLRGMRLPGVLWFGLPVSCL
jgi:hypothetical protein